MIVTAEQTYSRQTPTRLRLVAKAVKVLPVSVALNQLEFMNKKAAKLVLLVLKQAVANAVHNHSLNLESLVIKDIIANEGPRFRRMRAVSRGRGHAILKRTSHLRVILQTLEPKSEVKTESKAADKKVETTKISLVKPTVKKEVKVKKVTAKKSSSVSKEK